MDKNDSLSEQRQFAKKLIEHISDIQNFESIHFDLHQNRWSFSSTDSPSIYEKNTIRFFCWKTDTVVIKDVLKNFGYINPILGDWLVMTYNVD